LVWLPPEPEVLTDRACGQEALTRVARRDRCTMTDTPGTPAAPYRWQPIASAPRDGSWVVVQARECGQPFGGHRIMLARFAEPADADLRGWNNERPSGWRGFDVARLDSAGQPPELQDIVPAVFLDPRTRIRWP
jgi:hypothetical protein